MSVGYVSIRIAGALCKRVRRLAKQGKWFELFAAMALALPGVALLASRSAHYLIKQ